MSGIPMYLVCCGALAHTHEPAHTPSSLLFGQRRKKKNNFTQSITRIGGSWGKTAKLAEAGSQQALPGEAGQPQSESSALHTQKESFTRVHVGRNHFAKLIDARPTGKVKTLLTNLY